MKQFYFILYLVSSAVWGQEETAMIIMSPVNCSLPTTHNTSFNFTTANNGITGNYNALNSIALKTSNLIEKTFDMAMNSLFKGINKAISK